MNLSVSPAAADELDAAATFYARKSSPALGLAFVAEFEHSLGVISANPNLGKSVRGAVRVHNLRRFPYSIFYRVTSAELRILAIAHQRRRPEYWAGRP